jgi:hypothetical protein
MFTALRSVGLLDILSSMPAGLSFALAGKLPDTPCIHARLRRLATKSGEKCGLIILPFAIRVCFFPFFARTTPLHFVLFAC